MHGLFKVKFAEHEFKEARSASFWIFQLVFGCVCVWLLACLGFGFFVTLEFLFCLLVDCKDCLDVFEMQKYFQNHHAQDGFQRTEVKSCKR